MFMHVRLQLIYSHAWTCTLVRVEMERKTLDFFCWGLGCDLVDYYGYYMTHSLDGYDHA